ncbi:hypothetical protein NFI96_017478 [Prochilodus magdalenae]|nr:hypothetical protein NFI96_017478 [Prochilodus magdalenae]
MDSSAAPRWKNVLEEAPSSLPQGKVDSTVVLHQKFLMTKAATKTAIIECTFPSVCYYYIHWYQKKNETLKRVQSVEISDGTTQNEPDFEFLKSESVSECGSGYTYKVFGSGTRLIVTGIKSLLISEYWEHCMCSTDTDVPVVPPKLTAYPEVSLGNGKTLLLCQARDMFPDLVRFTWQKDKKNVDDIPLEYADEGKGRTSMLIVSNAGIENTFSCSVQHDSSSTTAIKPVDIPKEGPQTETPPIQPTATCPPQTMNNVEGTNSGSSDLVQKLYLFNLTYVSLLVKNVLYFCVVGVLLYKRRAGNSETVSKSSATPSQNN